MIGSDFDPKLFVALDVDTAKDAERIAESLGGLGLGFKLGPRLMLRDGARLVREIGRHGAVFIDCKHLDIPSTMESAVRAGFDLGAQYTTIHALAGPVALKQMAKVETELKASRHIRILTVTVLTSFSSDTLPFGLRGRDVGDLVEGLAVDSGGLQSFVCSPHEATRLRRVLPNSFLVTPGVRPQGTSHGDQVRVETPMAAAQAGASALVVGRPILEATQPREAAQKIVDEFKRYQSKT